MMILTPLLWCQGQEGPTLGIMGLFFQLTGSIVFLIRVVTNYFFQSSTYYFAFLSTLKGKNFGILIGSWISHITIFISGYRVNEPSLWLVINMVVWQDGKIDRAMITYVRLQEYVVYVQYTNCNLYFILPRHSSQFFSLIL